jgi:hypothetical protein
VPITALGRVVSVVLGIVGVIFTGMIVATAVHALREAAESVIINNRPKHNGPKRK